jgi:hypothetical protein
LKRYWRLLRGVRSSEDTIFGATIFGVVGIYINLGLEMVIHTIPKRGV